MNGTKVVFDNNDLWDLGYVCVSAENKTDPIFAGQKTLNKNRPINSLRYVKTKIVREPIVFSLCFSRIHKEWTWDNINELYRIFDVDNYKKIYFDKLQINEDGKLSADTSYQAYYNVIPCVNSASELFLTAQKTGFVEIQFETDAGNAWVDMEVEYTRTADTLAEPWMLPIPNISNVRNCDGDYKVYPYVKVEFQGDCNYVAFRGSATTEEEWTILNLGDLTQHPERKGCTIELDGENEQFFYYLANGTEGDLADVWDIMNNSIVFPWLEKGEKQMYHRLYISEGAVNYPVKVTIKAAYPVNIAGMLEIGG